MLREWVPSFKRGKFKSNLHQHVSAWRCKM